MNDGRHGETAWRRLAELVANRRVVVGYRTQKALADAMNVSIRTVNDLERVRRTGYNSGTLALLEQVLQWEPGSIRSILAGGDPTPIRSPAPTPGSFSENTESPLNDDPPPFGLRDRTEQMIWDMEWEPRQWRIDAIIARRERTRNAG